MTSEQHLEPVTIGAGQPKIEILLRNCRVLLVRSLQRSAHIPDNYLFFHLKLNKSKLCSIIHCRTSWVPQNARKTRSISPPYQTSQNEK